MSQSHFTKMPLQLRLICNSVLIFVTMHVEQVKEGLRWHRFGCSAEPESPTWTVPGGDGLALFVNLTGQKRWKLTDSKSRGVIVAPKSIAIGPMGNGFVIEGLAAQGHSAMVLGLENHWLTDCLGGTVETTIPDWLPRGNSSVLTTPLKQEEMAIVQQLESTPAGPLRMPWMEARLRCLVCSVFHRTPVASDNEFFCLRYHRVSDERVERTQAWLIEHLDHELDLKALARDVGCSHYYLSRIFSERTGQTIRQCHRRLRIEEATRLLQEGKLNVSEVAVEIGYRSLSHFTKAFREQVGCLPSQFSDKEQK